MNVQHGQIGMVAPELTPVLGQMIMFGVRGFRAGRELEGELEQAIAMLGQRPQQPPQQDQQQAGDPSASKPDPRIEIVKLQQQQEIEAQKLNLAVQKAQADLQLQREKMAAEIALKEKELQAKTAIEIRKLDEKAALEREKAYSEYQKSILEAQNMQIL